MSTLTRYLVTTTKAAIITMADSPERAVAAVMASEYCPVRSVLSVVPYNPASERKNPYPTQKGFGIRVAKAKMALEAFGRDERRRPYCRAFDDCFENHDGDAVVWALMDKCKRGNANLTEGIRRMFGGNDPKDWMAVYTRPHGEVAS